MSAEPHLHQLGGADLGQQAWVPRKGDAILAAEHFKPAEKRSYPRQKPGTGGLWTSTWHESHGSDWIQWCLSEDFDDARQRDTFRIWTLDPEPEARICVVDTYADLEAIVTAYPDRRESDLCGFGGGTHVEIHPHWGRLSRDFDAFHVTEEGQWRTRLTMPLDLYGWDCESTFWFRWAFTAVEDMGEVRCVVRDEESVA